MSPLDDYVTLPELAAQCGVDVRTVRRWANTCVPGLPITRLGRRPLVHKDDLAEWLRARRTQHNVGGHP